MSFIGKVSEQVNLRWAWEKVRKASVPGDVWVNEIELADFELQLEQNLEGIAADLKSGSYRMSDLRPMAFPKNPDKHGKAQLRQYFNVSVRDQVAWVAIVNVIGPSLDQKMPAWSYGNRLFRSIWVEEDSTGIKRRKIGRYRHSSGKIYLPFQQGWPIFRRHVFLSVLAMTSRQDRLNASCTLPIDLSQEDSDELEIQTRLESSYCPFVRPRHWGGVDASKKNGSLYWCSIDLEKFYPSIKLDLVCKNILNNIDEGDRNEASGLIRSMLVFPVDTDGWDTNSLKLIGLNGKRKYFKGIPTGLLVSGFLSNVGLLEVDKKVDEALGDKKVAHFRYVDDHIILAYTLDDLVDWVNSYINIIHQSGTGVKVNKEKIEPTCLSKCLKHSFRRGEKAIGEKTKLKIEEACRLDPRFPSPLMTKTLTLVSSLARENLNLLEENQLAALSNQLEHLLLVDLPEEEIPEKTRLSFAATKLVKVAECWLSNDEQYASIPYKVKEIELSKFNKHGEIIELSAEQEEEVCRLKNELIERDKKLSKHSEKVFSLLRKVLSERPDRVRLWTRAIRMCRQTGVNGVKVILGDIDKISKENPLAADYLLANSLCLVGTQALVAARMITSTETPKWKRVAAKRFIIQITEDAFRRPERCEKSWFLLESWNQFCLGVFCANEIIQSSSVELNDARINLPDVIIQEGLELIRSSEPKAVSRVWWGASHTLTDLSPQAESWVLKIANLLPPSSLRNTLWRYFPYDVPIDILAQMDSIGSIRLETNHAMDGWWYDALHSKKSKEIDNGCYDKIISIAPENVIKAMEEPKLSDYVSLYEWCEYLKSSLRSDRFAELKVGEWTALEIVRQICCLFPSTTDFYEYYKNPDIISSVMCLHPANFWVPRKWISEHPVSWESWVQVVRGHEIKKVPLDVQIKDYRYEPVADLSGFLSSWINQVRGAGLILYGLLSHGFELPVIWNGPGHTDVLSLMPRLLMRETTFSSWTLGLLQSCLQPRSLENSFILMFDDDYSIKDDDMLYDPLEIKSLDHAKNVIVKCQKVLEDNQISTFNHRARQLIPVSIKQLSNPNWKNDFPLGKDNNDGNDIFSG